MCGPRWGPLVCLQRLEKLSITPHGCWQLHQQVAFIAIIHIQISNLDLYSLATETERCQWEVERSGWSERYRGHAESKDKVYINFMSIPR